MIAYNALDTGKLKQIKLKNRVQTLLLLILMAGFVGLLGLWILGEAFALSALFVILIIGIFNPVYSPYFIMRAYGAKPINEQQSPQLYLINQQLAQRARLDRAPQLYYLPIGTLNAFATGSYNNTVIGLSDALLRTLDIEELAGVLAHEISHIKHHDMRIMSLADTMGMLTRTLSLTGQILLLLLIPAQLLGMLSINLLAFAILILAPLASALIQLAISRNREFLADLSAAQLLGDPRPLQNALIKLDSQNSYWERLYRASTDNSILRTHPTTRERIEQLNTLYKPSQWQPFDYNQTTAPDRIHHNLLAQKAFNPRRTGRYYWF